MQALGLIETRGLVAAVESADAMLKAADVTLLEKTIVGGGLVTIVITGGVSAVKAAVDAGAAAVNHLNEELLLSVHVIPRPHEGIDELITAVKPAEDKAVTEVTDKAAKEYRQKIITGEATKQETVIENPAADTIEEASDSETTSQNKSLKAINKENIDQYVLEFGYEKVQEILEKLKVVKLRNLAREYKNLRISGRKISNADKKVLLAEFKEYYRKMNE